MRGALLLFVAIAGCAAPPNAPSLAPRAVEQRGPESVMPVPGNVRAIDPVLTAKIAALVAQADAGMTLFTRTERETAASLAAGRGASEGSEAWVGAEAARSALEVARQRTSEVLTELEELSLAQARLAADDPGTADNAELETARGHVASMVSLQSDRIAALR